MNQCNFIGILGRDWTVTYSSGGKAVAKTSLAVKKYNKDTNWVPLVAFGVNAENLAKFTAKGSQIGISGELDVNQYEKDGEKKVFTSVIVSRFTFVGQKQQNDNQFQEQ